MQVKSLRKHTTAFLDCHLCVLNPQNYIKDMAAAGANQFTFHIETAGVDMDIEKAKEIAAQVSSACVGCAFFLCVCVGRGGGGVGRNSLPVCRSAHVRCRTELKTDRANDASTPLPQPVPCVLGRCVVLA
jgi:hypothetical protein